MHTREAKRNQIVDIVYNLREYDKELYLPEAWIVSRDKQGHLAHIQQRATSETIGAFHLDLNDSRKKLFKIIHTLEPAQIVNYFHKGKRKAPRLIEMLEDRDLARAIQNYVHRRLDILLIEVSKHQLPLSWAVERRVLVKDYIVDINTTPLEPHLHFTKTDDAVLYKMALKEDQQILDIINKEVIALTNQPKGWVIIDYKLYQLQYINGFLVKPFRQKTTVTIPSSSVNTYFRKFILKIANKVEIDAVGFEIIHFNHLEKCVLEPIQDIFNHHWVLAVQMHYKDAPFGCNESKEKRTTLEIKDEGIRIIKVARNRNEEAIFIKKLRAFPLIIPEDKQQFELKDSIENPYALLEWLARERTKIEAAGFDIIAPNIGDKKLQLQPNSIHIELETESDWFDLKGNITVGEFCFPFIKMAKYIKDENRLFPLPDGTFFLIPEEWMTRYKGITDFGKKDGSNLRLTKSQYTLLEEIGLAEETEETVDLPVFKPSKLLKAQLRPYQLAGAQWLANLYHQGLGACLADDI